MSIKTAIAAAALGAATMVPAAHAADDLSVVLVHGAWANGSSWSEVVPLLQQMFADGMKATAVHVASSHVPMLSQPQVVADAIAAAVAGVE
jgi:hypothetical protein